MRKKWIGKLRSRLGESLSETLLALLIIVLALTMLAGNIVAAENVNHQTRAAQTAFTTEHTSSSDGKAKITYQTEPEQSETISVTIHTTSDENEYVYYNK